MVHAWPTDEEREVAARIDTLDDALAPIAERLIPAEAALGAPFVVGAAMGVVVDRDGRVLPDRPVRDFDGITLPVRTNARDFRYLPLISLASSDPLGALYHEANHVNLREGRFNAEEREAIAASD